MRDVCGLVRQHELGIGRDLDLARAAAEVGYRDATDLGIVFARDKHLQDRGERSVAALELCTVLVESNVVVVGLDAARLKSRRPYILTADVAQEYVGTPVVAGCILAPAGDRQISPAAETRAGSRDHYRIASVGQQ